MQHEITAPKPLLNGKGNLTEPGWARSQLLQYDRDAIKASKLRVKEWDYYIINNQEFGVALTLADNSYMGLISASILDFKSASECTSTIIKPFSLGKYHMPPTSDGDVHFSDKRSAMHFVRTPTGRTIHCSFKNFIGHDALEVNMELEQPPMDSMVIATPFEKPRAFYYNQKINCMRAKGTASVGERVYKFDPANSFATLDWGRGVWTYRNTWYWGNANGILNGRPFGFNIGYGFGDTSMASENMLFYDHKAHKLDGITFHIPEDSFLKPWKFTSTDGRFEMDFSPIIDRAAKSGALIIESDQHQVFGRFTGRAVLDDGSVLELNDFLGFAEKVINRY